MYVTLSVSLACLASLRNNMIRNKLPYSAVKRCKSLNDLKISTVNSRELQREEANQGVHIYCYQGTNNNHIGNCIMISIRIIIVHKSDIIRVCLGTVAPSKHSAELTVKCDLMYV